MDRQFEKFDECDFYKELYYHELDFELYFKEKVKEYEQVTNSELVKEKYNEADNTIKECIYILRIIAIYSIRFNGHNSLFESQIDMLLESLVHIMMAYKNGSINPVYRELRYLIEVSIKYNYIDLILPDKSIESKIKNYDTFVSRSRIDEIEKIDFSRLSSKKSKEFIDEIKGEYSKLCAFVHPSIDQIEEYRRRCKKGNQIGFESGKDISKLVGHITKVCEMILVIYFSNCAPGILSDVKKILKKENNKISKRKYLSEYIC